MFATSEVERTREFARCESYLGSESACCLDEILILFATSTPGRNLALHTFSRSNSRLGECFKTMVYLRRKSDKNKGSHSAKHKRGAMFERFHAFVYYSAPARGWLSAPGIFYRDLEFLSRDVSPSDARPVKVVAVEHVHGGLFELQVKIEIKICQPQIGVRGAAFSGELFTN
jgi:hypothetical protein